MKTATGKRKHGVASPLLEWLSVVCLPFDRAGWFVPSLPSSLPIKCRAFFALPSVDVLLLCRENRLIYRFAQLFVYTYRILRRGKSTEKRIVKSQGSMPCLLTSNVLMPTGSMYKEWWFSSHDWVYDLLVERYMWHQCTPLHPVGFPQDTTEGQHGRRVW